MRIIIDTKVYDEIYKFYMNMYRKYRHSWSVEEIHNLIDNTFDSIYGIENGLIRRESTISKWKGLYMATTRDRKWNFAYRIEGGTVYIEDACHAQNMHESKNVTRLTESKLRHLISECIRKILSQT